MKPSFKFSSCTRLLLGLGLAFAAGLRAADAQTDAQLNPPQVDQLMGPIALYPDALVAIILPASTNPADIVLAARFLSTGGDPDQIDNQPWNESVKALAHYPMVIKWMDENLTWTQQLGSAFLNQPDEVMTSVQRLRTRARATGALTSTPQQKLVLDGDVIEIVPAQPDVIYVPYYDPEIVYVEQPNYYYGGPYLTFGLGLPIGFWLSYDFNWRTRVILVGDRNHNWRENRDWNRQTWTGGNQSRGNWHTWNAPTTRPAFARPDARRTRPDIVRPNPLPGAPAFAHDPRSRDAGRPRPDTAPRDGGNHQGPPVPAATSQAKPDNRDRRTPPIVSTSRPENIPVPGNPPVRTGPGYQSPPIPSNNPPTRSEDNRDGRDNRSTSQPTGPRPENVVPVVTSQPRPVPPAYQPPARDVRVAPAPDVRVAPADSTRVAPERTVRVPPSRPEQRQANPPPQRQAAPPPPPPPPPPQQQQQDRDPRDKDKDVQR